MTDTTPADLAKFVHPVPVGATIPAGMGFMEFNRTGGYFRGPLTSVATGTQLYDAPPRWTAEPLTAPKPPLPTEVGSVIANVQWKPGHRPPHPGDTCAVMVLGRGGKWHGVDSGGSARNYEADEITDWTPARIVTDEPVGAAEPDLMDESDKRPRIDSDGDRVWWREGEQAWTYGIGSSCLTLAEYAEKCATITGWADR